MKRFIFVIFGVTQITIAQIQIIEDDPTINVKPELYFWNELPTSQFLSLELLTTAYSFGYRNTLNIATECINCSGGIVENGGGLTNIGWDLIKEYDGTPNNRDFYGWGLYKVLHPLSNQYFYLDFRDCGFDRFYPPGSSPDSHIKLLADGELTYAYTDN
ncbi:MAG: hypothetical protein PHW27_05345, partial [Melioribacteraceae bacterium]|nr:hypothetical protein [Melioribacteraceae bacterium]